MKEKQSTEKRKKNGGRKPASKPSGKTAKAKSKGGRLGPGELDKLVLDHMRRHRGKTPHTASAIGKGIKRSSGAVANCLVRLEKQEKVWLAKSKPRSYALAEGKRR